MTISSKLKRIWYSALGDKEQEMMLENSSLLHFKKNETIIKQGSMAGHILYLEKGMAKLSIGDGDRSTTFKIIADDSFVGLMCSFVGKTLDFSAVAIRPSVVRYIDRDVFEQLIRGNGDFAVAVVRQMSLMTNKIVHDLIYLNHKNADGAVATILIELSSIFKGNSFQLPFTRVELADTVGYSKESIINCLSFLHREKIVRVSGKNIEIVDEERLEMIARNG